MPNGSLKGKFCRLPWSRVWTQILDHHTNCGNQIRIRPSRGKAAVWINVTDALEIRDKTGAKQNENEFHE
jgi:hypothetical protein